MIEYDDYLGDEPVDDTGAWLCPDKDCTGHLVPGQHCTDPIMYDETEEGVCP
jgi:hypothetical protein